MKKTNLIGGLLVLFSLQSFAQTQLMMVKPVDSNLWGYANEKGVMVIPAKYEKCKAFSSDGIAAVLDPTKGEFIFIDTKGVELKTVAKKLHFLNMGINCGYHDGLVAIKEKDKWGYLNTKGEWAIKPTYSEVGNFINGFANATIGPFSFIIDKNGNKIDVKSKSPVRILDEFSQSDPIAVFKIQDSKLEGLTTTDGTVIVEPIFKSTGKFVKGIAWFKNPGDFLTVGFINTKAEVIIKPIYKAAQNFEETGSIARVKLDTEEWIFINSNGEKVNFNYPTTEIQDFSEGLAGVKIGEKLGFINLKGELVIKPEFDGIREFHNGYAAVKRGELWGLINTKGEVVTQPKYIGIRDVEIIK